MFCFKDMLIFQVVSVFLGVIMVCGWKESCFATCFCKSSSSDTNSAFTLSFPESHHTIICSVIRLCFREMNGSIVIKKG